jgi:ATP-binding cassette subfamily B protein
MSRAHTVKFLMQLSIESYKTLSKKYKIRLFLGCMIVIIGCSLSAGVQLIFKEIVDSFIGEGQAVWLPIYFFIAAYSTSWTINQVSNIVGWLITEPVIAEISKYVIYKMFHHLLHLPYQFFLTKDAHSIHTYFETVFRSSSSILSNLFIYIIPSLLEMIIIFIFFIKLYSLFFGFFLIILLFIFFWLTYRSIEASKSFDASYYGQLEKFHALLIESIDQIILIKTYHAFIFQKEKMRKIMNCFFIVAKHRMWHLDKAQALQVIASGITLFLITLLSGYHTFKGKMSTGDFIMINNYFIQFTIPITFLGFIFADIYREFILLKKSIFIFSLPIEINKEKKTKPLINFSPSIRFENVSVSFHDKNILESVSFTIQPYEKVAIVGASGSGKSTCLKLITELYTNYQGDIFISDTNIKELSREDIATHIGIVLQQSFLFQGSIAENICYGEKNISEEKIIEVLKKVRLYDKIKLLENGIHELIEGIDFSGGEKQRIAIARALVRNPEIFLFDEITASLDGTTEKEIQKYIYDLISDKTAIFVTHRLSFAMEADKIIVIKKGKIVGIGSHDELIKNVDEYKKLYEGEEKINSN